MQKLSWRKLTIAIITLLLLWLGWQLVQVVWQPPSSYQQVKQQYTSSETIFLDRQGRQLQRLRTDFKRRAGSWQQLDYIANPLVKAVILSEDKRFYQHNGVDFLAIASAMFSTITGNKRGASTISMQLYTMLKDDGVYRAGKRSINEKIRQIFGAWWLEWHWSKQQILEAYLNLLPFRAENLGVDAASQALFGKEVYGLAIKQASILAVLIRSPNAKKSIVTKRACKLMQQLTNAQVQKANSCFELGLIVEAALQRNSFSSSNGIAMQAARRAWHEQKSIAEKPPKKIGTSIDLDLQRYGIDLLNQQLRNLQQQNVGDGAVLVLDNATGEILAYVGSSSQYSKAQQMDFIQANRQAGSTLKPFLVAQAIQEKRLTAASLIYDSPEQFKVGNSLYVPQNYDHSFKGWVSVRRVLGSSLNIPSIKILAMVSANSFADKLQQLGFNLTEDGDYYGLSLALGSLDVSLAQLTNAYRALANGGQYQPIAPLNNNIKQQQLPTNQVLDNGASFIVGNILSDDSARILTFGYDSILKTPSWAAVKTGTSKDMRDNWAVGFSDTYTVGVWVGNADGSPMQRVSGISGAAPVWAKMMRYLQQNKASKPPKIPAKVVKQQVQFNVADWQNSNYSQRISQHSEASRMEYFLQGTQLAKIIRTKDSLTNPITKITGQKQKNSNNILASKSIQIVSPKNGSTVALDPDIPKTNQQLLLKANSQQHGLQWQINGKKVGVGTQLHWFPSFGNKRIELLNSQGELLDKIKIQVRGMPPDWLLPVISSQQSKS